MKAFIPFIFGICSCSVALADNFDLVNIALKNKSEVEKLIGVAERCATVSPSKVGSVPKCIFGGGKIEIVFINEKADWIIINKPGIRFEKNALGYLGLPEKHPDMANGFVMRWKGVGGYREISAFMGLGNGIDYFYIKAATD